MQDHVRIEHGVTSDEKNDMTGGARTHRHAVRDHCRNDTQDVLTNTEPIHVLGPAADCTNDGVYIETDDRDGTTFRPTRLSGNGKKLTLVEHGALRRSLEASIAVVMQNPGNGAGNCRERDVEYGGRGIEVGRCGNEKQSEDAPVHAEGHDGSPGEAAELTLGEIGLEWTQARIIEDGDGRTLLQDPFGELTLRYPQSMLAGAIEALHGPRCKLTGCRIGEKQGTTLDLELLGENSKHADRRFEGRGQARKRVKNGTDGLSEGRRGLTLTAGYELIEGFFFSSSAEAGRTPPVDSARLYSPMLFGLQPELVEEPLIGFPVFGVCELFDLVLGEGL